VQENLHSVQLRLDRMLADLTGLMDSVQVGKAGSSQKPRRRAANEDQLDTVRVLVKQMHEEGVSQTEMCNRLHDQPRPPRATWRELRWDQAIRDRRYRNAVKSFLSKMIRER
jgi:hypothetical protein